jgi:flagellar FliJ protein
MKKFVFPLQKILDLREFEEEKAKLELGKAVAEMERIKKLLAENAQNRVNAGYSRQDVSDIISLQTIENYILGLDIKKEKLLEDLAVAELIFEKKRDLFTEAMQAREVLTKLKDKQLAEYKKDALKQEENALDDITNGKVANSLD